MQELLKGTAPQLAIGIAQAVEATSALMSQLKRDSRSQQVSPIAATPQPRSEDLTENDVFEEYLDELEDQIE